MGGDFPVVSSTTIKTEMKKFHLSNKSITHVPKLLNEAETLPQF